MVKRDKAFTKLITNTWECREVLQVQRQQQQGGPPGGRGAWERQESFLMPKGGMLEQNAGDEVRGQNVLLPDKEK